MADVSKPPMSLPNAPTAGNSNFRFEKLKPSVSSLHSTGSTTKHPAALEAMLFSQKDRHLQKVDLSQLWRLADAPQAIFADGFP